MARLPCVALGFLCLCPDLAGQEPRKLADLAWLEGQWHGGVKDKSAFEEHWSAPAAGGMMGMFRLLQGGKLAVYEFPLIEQDGDDVVMRLRHYRAQMADVDKAPIRLKLTEISSDKYTFENPDNDKPKRITYARETPDRIVVTVETVRDGDPARFTLHLERAKTK